MKLASEKEVPLSGLMGLTERLNIGDVHNG